MLNPRKVVPIASFISRDFDHDRYISKPLPGTLRRIADHEAASEEIERELLDKLEPPSGDVAENIASLDAALEVAYANPAQLSAHREVIRLFGQTDPTAWTLGKTLSEGCNAVAREAHLFGHPETRVVIKVARTDQRDRSEEYIARQMEHEAVLGLWAINALRRLIPNFAMVYGTLVDGGRRLVAYEHIRNAREWDEVLCNTPTVDDILQCWIQVACAEVVAGEQCDFSHNDLHVGNLLFKELGEEDADPACSACPETGSRPRLQTIQYAFKDGTKFSVVTNKVAVLIDLGMATAEVEVPERGKFRLCSENVPWHHGISPFRSNRGYDVYRLIMNTMHTLKLRGERELIKALMPVVTAFTRGDSHRARQLFSDEAAEVDWVVPAELDFDPRELVRLIARKYTPSWLRVGATRTAGVRRSPVWRAVRGRVPAGKINRLGQLAWLGKKGARVQLDRESASALEKEALFKLQAASKVLEGGWNPSSQHEVRKNLSEAEAAYALGLVRLRRPLIHARSQLMHAAGCEIVGRG